jgi:hypothetical protein
MSRRDPPPDPGGITSQQITTTANLVLGIGTFKKAIMANHTSHNEEFSYAGLQSAGGPGNYANGHYVIVSVEDFTADRLLSELQLQFDFSKSVLATLPDGSVVTLSPKIYALRIQDKSGAFSTHYGEHNIISALESAQRASVDGGVYDFLIAMERVNYNMGPSGSAITPADVINADPSKLIHLINVVLKLGVLLTDIKVKNLSVKCSSSRSCEMGVIDLDNKFVADVTGWNWLVNLGFTDAVNAKLAEQYMVLMVCFVGLNNGLTDNTKTMLLKKVGLLSHDGIFDVGALNRMLQYEGLKSQIKHYLGFDHDQTGDIGQGFNDEYIKGELFGAVVASESAPTGSIPERPRHYHSTPDSSYDGGKSRRKHKKTRKRKPKSRKTRRKRSLLNRVKAWDR